jgi:hypothetical protein
VAQPPTGQGNRRSPRRARRPTTFSRFGGFRVHRANFGVMCSPNSGMPTSMPTPCIAGFIMVVSRTSEVTENAQRLASMSKAASSWFRVRSWLRTSRSGVRITPGAPDNKHEAGSGARAGPYLLDLLKTVEVLEKWPSTPHFVNCDKLHKLAGRSAPHT